MMNENIPPKVPILNINTVSQDHYKPMIVYLTHEINNRMTAALHEDGISWDTFFQLACIGYLNKRQKEREELNKWISFSEMQLFEEPDTLAYTLELSEESTSESEDIRNLFKQ
jgi:hypothetical protein